MTEWFMCIFARTLPWASVLRVWDMFFCEGTSAPTQPTAGPGVSTVAAREARAAGRYAGALASLYVVWGPEKRGPGLGSSISPKSTLPPGNLKPKAAPFPPWGLHFLICEDGNKLGIGPAGPF